MNPHRHSAWLLIACMAVTSPQAVHAQTPQNEARSAEQWATQLESKKTADRRKAVYALYQLGAAARPHVRPIARRLRDTDKYVRDTTERVLARWQFGSVINVLIPAVPELIDALGDDRGEVRIAAINLLWKVGPIPNVVGQAPPPDTLVPALANALSDSEARVRANAAACLMNVTKHAGPARPALAKATADPDATVRLWAMRAAPAIDAKWAGPLALSRVDDPDVFVREAVAAALGQVPPPASIEVHAGLDQLLKDAQTSVQIAAVDAMWMLGDAQSGTRLTAIVAGDGDPALRGRAAMALGGLGDPTSLNILLKALDDPAPAVQSGAVSGLGRLGPEGGSAMERIVKLLDSENEGVRSSVVMAASTLAPWAKAAIPGVVEVASDQQSTQRGFAMSALYALALEGHRDPRMLDCAIRALDKPDKGTHVYAIQVVGAFGPAAGAAVPVLRRLLAQDSGWNERRSLYWTVAGMRESGAPLEGVLKAEFENEEQEDRAGAAMALACVGRDAATRDRCVAYLAQRIAGDQGVNALVRLQRIGAAAQSSSALIRAALAKESYGQSYAAGLMLQFGGEDAARAKSWFESKLTTSPGRAHLTALADAGPAAKELVPILQTIAIDPSHKQRNAALRAMRKIGARGEAVRAAYTLARKDPSPYTRTLGALGLRSLR